MPQNGDERKDFPPREHLGDGVLALETVSSDMRRVPW